MTSSTRTLFIGFGAFVASALIAFFAGQSIGSDSSPAPVAPTVGIAEQVLVPVHVAPDDDPVEVILARVEEESASRQIASELEVPLDPAATGFGVGVSEPVPEPSEEQPPVPAEPEPPEPTGPGGGGDPATDSFEDACADGGEGCPEGVGGYVLSAIRAIPPLQGSTAWAPGEDSPYPFAPTCPAIDVPAGAAYFGASTSRPVTITIDYRAGRWTGSGYEEQGRFTFTTPDALETGWDAWIADESAAADDPRSWIQQCFLLEGLAPRDDYTAHVTYADKDDPTVVATDLRNPIPFDVYLESGFLPSELRRPTFLLGVGIDELLIGVTARPDHRFVAVALPGAGPGSCDTGGDETTILSDPSIPSSERVSDTEIPADRLSDPEYPYFPDHTRSLVHRLWLEEGTDYVVCLYWLEGGTSFDATVVEIAEEVTVSTPEAYRPRVRYHGLTELFGSIVHGRILITGCGSYSYEVAPFTTADTSQLLDEPFVICEPDTGLTRLDRGLRIQTSVFEDFDTGRWYNGGAWIRTDLECHADPCLLKFPELYRVPLPSIPTEHRLCGTGFGGGCDGEVPTRPAGYAELELVYVHTPGNGLTEWSIGEADEFEDTPPPAEGIAPRLDVTIDYGEVTAPADGATATVTITADREITFNANVQDAPGCGLDPVTGASGDEFATVHTFTLDHLCLGYRYGLSVIAYDRTRAAEGTIYTRFGEVGTRMDFDVPPVLLYHSITARVNAPNEDGTTYTAYVRPVRFAVPNAALPYGTTLGWSWSESDRSVARANGWQMFGLDGQANACSGETPGTLTVNAARRLGLATQDEVVLTLVVDVHENRPIGGSVVGPCAVGDLVQSHVLQATVTVADLLAGVTILDDTGRVELTIQATTWRRELVG